MTHDHKPPRQPLLWGAWAFSFGLWMGARAWRPPSWWVAAFAAFVLAALWFLPKRTWLAKGLSLSAWVLLGAFLIQVRCPEPSDPRLLALADGREVTLTAYVVREGYVRSAGSRSTRESIDVETEAIESAAGSNPVHTNLVHSSPVQSNLIQSESVRVGVRLTIYEPSENSEPVARRPEEQPLPPLTYGTRLRIRAEAASRAEFPQSGRLRL